MKADEILNKAPFTDSECSLIYRWIIYLFEHSDEADSAFNLYDSRIQNYCNKTGFTIIPKNVVNDVDNFYRKLKDDNLISKYSAGCFVFSHNAKNQLRQLIRHMRNACSHAGIRIVVKEGGIEYYEFKAVDPIKKKIKFIGIVKRNQFEELWKIIINTITFQ